MVGSIDHSNLLRYILNIIGNLYRSIYIGEFMAEGASGFEVRKVQLTGGATYTISLPKAWVVENSIQAKNPLRIDWRPSGALRITPLNMVENKYQRAILSCEEIQIGSLHDHLMGAYISGADEILITNIESNIKQYQAEIRRFLKNTRGFEIIDEENKSMRMVCLLNSGEMPLYASLNRMYSQLVSLMRDILLVFDGEGIELIEDVAEREADVDAMLYLVERQVRVALDSHLVASSLKVSRHQALEYSNLARSLERMMDHAFQIGTNLIEFEMPKLAQTSAPLSAIPQWLDALKELMINIRTRESSRIEAARNQLKQAQKLLESHEEILMRSNKKAATILFEFKLSESLRRQCAYARDFGEILLNLKVNDEMFSRRAHEE